MVRTQHDLFVRQWFGEPLMDFSREDDAIARIVERERYPDGRERMYRQWCKELGVPVERSKLRRVRAGRLSELQRAMFTGS